MALPQALKGIADKAFGAEALTDAGRMLLLAGAVGSATFFAAQIFQAFVLIGLPDAARDPAALHRFAVSPANLLRKGALLVAIVALVVTYGAVFMRVVARALRRTGFASRLGWATIGLSFAVCFVGFELLIRSVDLFVITEWRLRWLEGDATSRARLGGWIQTFNDITVALYLPLLISYAGASFCFAATLAPLTRLDRAMQVAFAVHGTHAVVRIAGMHLGQAWLEPFERVSYLPVALGHAFLLALWLGSAARHRPSAADS